MTLRELLDMAGGVDQGRQLKAVLFGGAAGAFATAAHLDVRLTFEDLREAGLPLGSGVVMVFDDRRDMRAVLAKLGHFFAHESCGKCYPCQLGTQRQKEVLDAIAAGKPRPGDVERLQDVGWTMIDASLCGLGQTAATAVLSALKLWPEMFSSGNAPGSAPVRPTGKGSVTSRSRSAAESDRAGTKRPVKKAPASRARTGKSAKRSTASKPGKGRRPASKGKARRAR